MSEKVASQPKPEEEELRLKRLQLQELEGQLVERELQLVSLRKALSSFESLYLRTVGVLYAELDEIEAQIAEARAHREPSNQGAQEAAREARVHADETRFSTAEIGVRDSLNFSTPPSLKALYREVARRIHPDLATDDVDRAYRQRLMALANRAYEEGNEARLKEILEEYESSPEAVQGEGTGQELVRAIRKISQVARRLREIGEEIEQLLKSDLALLKSRAEEATKQGRDLLEEMAESLRDRIARGRQLLGKLDQASS